jgi:hypothetical protein
VVARPAPATQLANHSQPLAESLVLRYVRGIVPRGSLPLVAGMTRVFIARVTP